MSIGIALDTSQVLQGTRQVDAALKSVATASATTAQATQKMDTASASAAKALTEESAAAKAAASAMGEHLAKAVAAAAQSMIQAQREAKKVADDLKKAEQAAQAASQQVGGLGNVMRSFASQTASFALAQAGVMGFQQALQTAKDAVVDLVKTGIQMQNLRTSFTAVSGSVQAGAKDFQFVTKTALALGVGLQDVAAQYRSLSAATKGTSLAGADTRELFVTLSKAAQAYGLSTEQLGRAMTAFQQIISKGKVSMEELRGQLGEAIPGALQIAARAYGVTTDALEDMISKGVASEGFTRRFMAQLGSEVPAAAERAGKGITNLGTEITLLKEAIAQSQFLRWLDAGIDKTSQLLGLLRKAREAQREGSEYDAKKTLGPGVTLDKLTTDERAKLLDITEKLQQAEARLKSLRDQQAQKSYGFLTGVMVPQGVIDFNQRQVDALRAEQQQLAGAGTTRSGRAQSIEARQAELGEPGKAKKAREQEEKDLQDFLKGARAREEAAKKAEAAQQATSRIGLGRDPTLEEKVRLQEKLVKDNQEWLETNQKYAVLAKDDPAVKALRERGKAQEAATKGLVDAKQATQDAAQAETKRQQEAEAAEKKKQQAKEESDRLDKQQADEVGRTHHQNIEQLRRMAAQYTEVKTSRDADTASVLAQSLATSQYREEAEKALAVIKESTQALEDRRKVEEKLPKLREEAEASAGALRDIERLQKQLEPSRRSMSREEQLAATRAELAERSKGDLGVMARADEQIKKTLDTEMWEQWEEVGLNALDHVGQALEDFAFKGKLSFKDMMDAIAQDLFRFATQTLMQSATKKGGWLEMGLDLGLKALSIYTKTPMPSAGPLTGGDAPGMQHGGPVSAGRPYMVGEAGPELYIPKTSGTIVPNSKLSSGPTVINVHVSGVQDAQSFVQSRGAVSRAMMGALSQARQQM